MKPAPVAYIAPWSLADVLGALAGADDDTKLLVEDALSPLGVRIREMPLSSTRIWELIEERATSQ